VIRELAHGSSIIEVIAMAILSALQISGSDSVVTPSIYIETSGYGFVLHNLRPYVDRGYADRSVV